MGSGRSVAAVVVACALVSCGDDPTSSPAPAAVAPAPPAPHAARVPPRDPRLRDDCGGWEPSAELLDAASAKDAVATIDKMPAAERIDVLRAGLRLADDAAARVCAARLEYQWMDRWECARCVGLLTADVLRPGTGADWEKFRSYLGSVELTPFLRALPPLPWSVDPGAAIGDLHRISRAADIPAYLELGRRPESVIADEAAKNVALLCGWNDDYRDEIVTDDLRDAGVPPIEPQADDAAGLPPRLAAWLRWNHLTQRYDEKEAFRTGVDGIYLRWLWECTPGPRDAELLMALTAHGDSDLEHISGVACLLLGKLHDPETAAFLLSRAADDDDIAVAALARRGDRDMIEKVAATAADDVSFPEFSTALLMEIDPVRARRIIEETLLGADDDAANRMLDGLAEFAAPGAFFEPCGYGWKRTSFDGLERTAIAAKIPPLRLARVGTIVPGCRTRACAAAAAARLMPGDLVDRSHAIPSSDFPPIAAYLETAAPAEFVDALRRIESAKGDDAGLATEWLTVLRDPDAGSERAALLAGRSVDAFVETLAAAPDDEHGDVGAVDDPRVRAYLARLRERRDLGHYWYATGQLAVLGDESARAEFWEAMQEGRYRIMDMADLFERSLGWDLPRTMPFWIDELRSQCCRIVTNGGGDIVDVVLGIDCYQSPWRTAYRRAKELWDAADGRFVRSRIAGHWVPVPR